MDKPRWDEEAKGGDDILVGLPPLGAETACDSDERDDEGQDLDKHAARSSLASFLEANAGSDGSNSGPDTIPAITRQQHWACIWACDCAGARPLTRTHAGTAQFSQSNWATL